MDRNDINEPLERKRPSSDKVDPNDPPESWTEYMDSKRSKLSRQASEAIAHLNSSTVNGHSANNGDIHLFSGVTVHTNGCVNPCNEELKEMVITRGGKFDHYFSRSTTTHFVTENLAASKIIQMRKEKNIKIVHPRWITHSIDHGRLLDCQEYSLYDREGNFRRLCFDESTLNDEDDDGNEECDREDLHDEDELLNNESGDDETSNISRGHSSTLKQPSLKAGDPGFLEVFFSKSRLHHLSTAGNDFKKYVQDKRLSKPTSFPGIDQLKSHLGSHPEIECSAPVLSNDGTIIMHIDMDCFFVSVGLLKRPDLVGKPVAVSHAKTGRGQSRLQTNTEVSGRNDHQSFNSFSEVSCCNYEARAFGIKNGMMLGTAKEKCPELNHIPYDFEEYNRVSKILYDLIFSFTVDVEAVSCDEMFVDIKRVLEECDCDPETLASFLRNQVKELTKCNASIGIGPNVLVAKLASKAAKPNGQLYVSPEGVHAFMMKQPLMSLHGIGRSTRDKLAEVFNVETCMDLMGVPKERLKAVFGVKSGDNLYNLCRGIDRSQLKFDQSKDRKSVSVEVNYGIRFTEWIDLESFLKELSSEIVKRMREASAKAKTISIKLKMKSKEAPLETAKFLGHGICDNVSRTTLLSTHTDTLDTISRAVINLVKSLKNLVVSDVRGIGIQATRLLFPDSESDNRALDSGMKSVTIEDMFSKRSSTKQSPPLSTHDVVSWNDLDIAVLKQLPQDIQKEIRDSFEQSNTIVNGMTSMRNGNSEKSVNRKTTKSKRKVLTKSNKSINLIEKMLTKNAREGNQEVVSEENIDSQVKQVMRQRGKLCGLDDLIAVTDVLREWVITEPIIQDEDVAYVTKSFMNSCSAGLWTRVKVMLESFHDAILERDRSNDEDETLSTSSWTDVYNTIIHIIRLELEDCQDNLLNAPSTSSSSANKLMEMQELKQALNELKPP